MCDIVSPANDYKQSETFAATLVNAGSFVPIRLFMTLTETPYISKIEKLYFHVLR